MKKFLALTLLFSSCFGLPKDKICEEATFPVTCNGQALSLCVDGFVSEQTCGGGTTCDEANAVCGFCGDGIVSNVVGALEEECDFLNDANCNNLCLTPICGDGILDPGEACEDGNTANGDGCRADCLGTELCGDGQIDLVNDELCDDGNNIEGDGCDTNCTASACGNGILAPGEVCFEPQRAFAVGARPIDVELLDLNGDNLTDIVSANLDGDSLSVLLGNGNGTFQPAITIPVGDRPFNVRTGDLNEDSILDIAVSNTNSTNVGVLLGTANSSIFGPQQTFPVGSQAGSMGELADVTGDGNLDVVLGDFNSSPGDDAIRILPGNGNGTLGAVQIFTVGDGASGVTIGNINEDNFPDIVVANVLGGTVSVLLGSGGGDFQPHQQFDAATPVGPALADMNEDGISDIVTSTVDVLLGNGDGTFQTRLPFPSAVGPQELIVEDVDGDGHLDVLSAGFFSQTVSVHLGDGDGTLQSAVLLVVNDGATGLAFKDLNGDGFPDVVVANQFANNVSVLLANP